MRLEHVARLGAMEDSVALMQFSRPALLNDGRFIVPYTYNEGQAAVYAADGTFLSSFGRQGKGPGEYAGSPTSRVAEIGSDTLVLIDGGLGRINYLTPDFTWIRSDPIMLGGDEYRFVDRDRIVMSRSIVNPDNPGMIHVHGRATGQTQSFGARRFERIDLRTFNSHRGVQTGLNGNIWAHHRNSFIVESWSIDGRLLSRFERSVSWFPDKQNDWPTDWFEDVVETPQGLWMIIADQSPATAPAPAPAGVERAYPGPAEQNEMYDTIFELIDPLTGDVILRRRAEQRFKGFLSEDLVYGYNELPNGLFVIDVYRFSVTGLD